MQIITSILAIQFALDYNYIIYQFAFYENASGRIKHKSGYFDNLIINLGGT